MKVITQKLKKKTSIGSKTIKNYDNFVNNRIFMSYFINAYLETIMVLISVFKSYDLCTNSNTSHN